MRSGPGRKDRRKEHYNKEYRQSEEKPEPGNKIFVISLKRFF
jgi:hypothetical protein